MEKVPGLIQPILNYLVKMEPVIFWGLLSLSLFQQAAFSCLRFWTGMSNLETDENKVWG